MSGLIVQLPDQRFVVLRAIARHDEKWARELAARAAAETREEAEKDSAAEKQRRPVGEKLLVFAEALLPTDFQTALSVARSTFHDPATMYLPRFLYEVARLDRAAADALFKEALAAYADRDIASLLYLSQYPFALNYSIAPTLAYMYSGPPAGFAADPELQRQFVAALLSFAGRRLAALAQQPPPDGGPYRQNEPETIYLTLRALETLYGARQPAALERITALEGQAITLISPERQRNVASDPTRDAITNPTGGSEDRLDYALEQAGREADPDRRDNRIAFAVMSESAATVPLEKVETAAQKIGDAEARGQVLNWLYFSRAQSAAKEGALDDARKLAERVEALDERALLFLDIADQGLKRAGDRARATDLLDAVVAASRRAPEMGAKARALLGVAYLYAKLDYFRALEVMREAVKTINRLRDPDLAAAMLIRKIQGKSFSTFMSHPMPGFSLENSFRELGAHDFEATLSAANDLDDKYLRATAALALVSKCLEDSQKPETRKPAKPSATAPKEPPATKKPDAKPQPKKQP